MFLNSLYFILSAHKKQSTSNTPGKLNPTDTRIFSPLAVAGLCVTIGRYWYLFKRLTAVSAGRFYRFEHIVSDSSFKAHSKQGAISGSDGFFLDIGGACSAQVQAQKESKRGRRSHFMLGPSFVFVPYPFCAIFLLVYDYASRLSQRALTTSRRSLLARTGTAGYLTVHVLPCGGRCSRRDIADPMETATGSSVNSNDTPQATAPNGIATESCAEEPQRKLLAQRNQHLTTSCIRPIATRKSL